MIARFASASLVILIYVAAAGVVGMLAPSLAAAIISGQGVAEVVSEILSTADRLRPARWNSWAFPFVACAAANAAGLPVLFALATLRSPEGSALRKPGGAASRAVWFALGVFACFLVAVISAANAMADRITVSGSWSLPFYVLIVAAYDLLFIPSAALACWLAVKLSLLRR